MADIPTMSLKVAPMQFAAFTPMQYTTQTADPTLLSRSMAAQEARQEKANQYLLAIDTTLAEKRKSLNKADYDWLAQQAENARAEVDKQLELGNWQSAIRVAQQSARDLTRNTELEDRIRANEIYIAERNKIQSGNYSTYTKRRWDAVNKYRFNGTADWKPTFDPTTDMSVADIWNLAVSRTPIRSKSSSWSNTRNTHTFLDNNGNLVNDITEQYTDENGNTNTRVADGIIGTYSTTQTTKGGSNSTQEKTESDIIAVFKDLLKDDNIRGALRQEFDNMVWLYDQANSVINNPNSTEEELKQAKADLDVAKSSLSNKEGFMYVGKKEDFDAWVNAQAAQYAKDSAYKHTTTSNNSSVISSYNDSALAAVAANRNAQAISQYSPQFATTQGPNVTYTAQPAVGGYNANSVMSLLPAPQDTTKQKVKIPYALQDTTKQKDK